MSHTDGNPSEHAFQASAAALDNLTTASQEHATSPHSHIHAPTAHESTHSLIKKLFPPQVIDSYEAKYHMGNYVIDRDTGEKTFESMSIYVRVGMHLLYYGTEQEKALHWKRTLDLLKKQSEKMGQQYDSPASKAHIVPFIQAFSLEESMVEMVKPNPDDHATFNEFFAREIKESARPIAEPENESVTSSPADCRLTAFPSIDLATKYWVKGHGFTMARLLGGEDLAREFDGGSMVIARLAPQVRR
jgi:phosphatidylserine decarboxylase